MIDIKVIKILVALPELVIKTSTSVLNRTHLSGGIYYESMFHQIKGLTATWWQKH